MEKWMQFQSPWFRKDFLLKIVYGMDWEQDLLGRYPSREDLDAACNDRPVIVSRACIHMDVINSKALQLAGTTNRTSVPVSPKPPANDRV